MKAFWKVLVIQKKVKEKFLISIKSILSLEKKVFYTKIHSTVRKVINILINLKYCLVKAEIKLNKQYFLVLFFLIFLSGCQSNNEILSFSNFFGDKSKNTVQQIDKKNLYKPIKFKKFSRQNLKKNIIIAVKNYPTIQSSLLNLEALRSEKKVVLSQKESQISLVGNLGATRSDSANSLGAAGTLSISKLIFDFGSIDYSLLSQEDRIQATEEQLNSQTQNIALDIYKVLFDLNRNIKISEIYDYGLNKSEPLINSIKNISASGYSDDSVILKAQKEYSELLVSNQRAKVLQRNSEILFLDYFPGQNIPNFSDYRVLEVSDLNTLKKKMLKNNSVIKSQELIIKSLEKSLESLINQKKPNVILQAGITSPANNPVGDSFGSAGLSVNYIFNDGGRIDYQIENILSKIEAAKKQKLSVLKQLDTRLKSVFQNYTGLTKAKKSLQELVNIIKQSRETAKAQLETGKTKIQDILSLEFELAKKEIELITLDTELVFSSYTLKYLSENLIPNLAK